MPAINARIIAPLAAFGATWAARRLMTTIYVNRKGTEPPMADDADADIKGAIGWAVATAVVSAVLEVTITRFAVTHTADGVGGHAIDGIKELGDS